MNPPLLERPFPIAPRLFLSFAIPLMLQILAPGVLAGQSRTHLDSYSKNTVETNFSCQFQNLHGNNLITGGHPYRYRSTRRHGDAYFDARGAVWRTTSDPNDPHSISVSAYVDICWFGGIILGDESIEWSYEHEGVRDNRAAMAFSIGGVGNQLLLAEAVVYGLKSGIQINSRMNEVSINNIWMSKIKGPCLKITSSKQVAITQSLLEGCRIIVDKSHRRGKSGRSFRVTIEDSLVSNNSSYGVNKAEQVTMTAISSKAYDDPIITLNGNVFLVRDSVEARDLGVAGVPLSEIFDCSDNVIVWLGGGGYPVELSECFSIVSDGSVWDRARSGWIHQRLLAELEDGEGWAAIEAVARSDSRELEPEQDLEADREEGGAARNSQRLQLLALADTTGRQRKAQGVTGFYWSDGTGWVDYQGTLISCRKPTPGVLRPMTASVPCRW